MEKLQKKKEQIVERWLKYRGRCEALRQGKETMLGREGNERVNGSLFKVLESFDEKTGNLQRVVLMKRGEVVVLREYV